jgi:hypothetical protein
VPMDRLAGLLVGRARLSGTAETLVGGDPWVPMSLTAFNESFGMSYRGELLSVSRGMIIAGGGASKLCCYGIRLNSWMKQEEKLPRRKNLN